MRRFTRTVTRRVRMGSVAAVGVVLLVAPTAGASPQATITGQFGDSCRAFTAHSSKDISHVVVRYVDGSAVKDETVDSPDYSVAGGPGDEIAAVVVKSGTTSESFSCADAPPTAVLEILTPSIGAGDGSENCVIYEADEQSRLGCPYDAERSAWTQWESPGLVLWAICPGAVNEHCAAYPFEEIPWTFDFRGSGSLDVDGDLSHWTIDFGDGTSAGRSWDDDPPVGVEHTYVTRDFDTGFVTVTLTVTDAAGNSDTDTLTLGLVAANDV